jgi:hypothetical protein
VHPYDHVWIAGLALFLGAFTIGAIESYAVASSRNGAASLVPVIGVEYVIAKNAPPADRGLVLGGSGALQMAGLLILAAGLSFRGSGRPPERAVSVFRELATESGPQRPRRSRKGGWDRPSRRCRPCS